MNKDIIHNAIENPELLAKLNTEDLEKISKQFPYFSAAQILLSKNYKQHNHYRFSDQLSQASLYSGNRNALFHYLSETNSDTNKSIQSTEQLTSIDHGVLNQADSEKEPEQLLPTFNLKIEELEAPIETFENAENDTRTFSSDMSGLVQFILNEDDKNESKKNEVPVSSRKENTIKLEHREQINATETSVIYANELDPLEREILLEAIQSSIDLELREDIKIEQQAPISKPFHSQTIDEKLIIGEDSFATWIFKRSQEIHFATTETSFSFENETTHSLGDWKHLSIEEQAQESALESEIQNDNLYPIISESAHHFIPMQVEDATKHQQNLIDRFIQYEPKITRNKSIDFAAGNLAKESLEEDFSFVTETMAILFAKQGRLDKARKAFKKLIALHPEKSIYFAAQLKNLDKFKKP